MLLLRMVAIGAHKKMDQQLNIENTVEKPLANGGGGGRESKVHTINIRGLLEARGGSFWGLSNLLLGLVVSGTSDPYLEPNFRKFGPVSGVEFQEV